jgi:uncharacterized membrane protein
VSAILLKFVHIIAIALWSGGLLSLPFLYRQRRDLTGDPLHRLHNFTRFFYVGLVSPAAFVAIGSGTILIFLEGTFEAWFSLKLALVGIMVFIHVLTGLMILRLFQPGQSYPAVRFVIVTLLTATVIAAILVAVLGKPVWLTPAWLADIFVPGALGRWLGELNVWPI